MLTQFAYSLDYPSFRLSFFSALMLKTSAARYNRSANRRVNSCNRSFSACRFFCLRFLLKIENTLVETFRGDFTIPFLDLDPDCPTLQILRGS